MHFISFIDLRKKPRNCRVGCAMTIAVFLMAMHPVLLTSKPLPSSSSQQLQIIKSRFPLPLPSSLLLSSEWKNKNHHQSSLKKPNTSIAAAAVLLDVGIFLASTLPAYPGSASAVEFSSLALQEPANALSLPTWAIHVSSVVEWITAMMLVWEYGEKSGYESWKGLSWAMVPLLAGAFCACTWHFFYNSESLDVLVALQGAFTVFGNFTMCIAAFRIYNSSKGGSQNS